MRYTYLHGFILHLLLGVFFAAFFGTPFFGAGVIVFCLLFSASVLKVFLWTYGTIYAIFFLFATSRIKDKENPNNNKSFSLFRGWFR